MNNPEIQAKNVQLVSFGRSFYAYLDIGCLCSVLLVIVCHFILTVILSALL